MNYMTGKYACFHIGRGGRYYNQGHLTFEGMCDGIDDVPAFEHLLLAEGEETNQNAEYTDEMGNGVGLTVGDVNTGIGCINLDEDYDTTYVTTLDSLTEKEATAICKAEGFVANEAKKAALNAFPHGGMFSVHDEQGEEIAFFDTLQEAADYITANETDDIAYFVHHTVMGKVADYKDLL